MIDSRERERERMSHIDTFMAPGYDLGEKSIWRELSNIEVSER